ncbi:hypothetical protein SAMN04488065_1866 [Haloplanus vescus]|uniref:DUF7835 domain-containing protein n=1 Tax=Haloplanus vescus TaxID=555874 RepID=A0A1H3YGA6_9EURY|nr:hypothetical protein [Haloplanus vescus]SEA10603.1 hypothetical protein SAMN04488065_1866 [Haloplanus vescus]
MISDTPDSTAEHCSACGAEQSLDISVEILTENPAGENAAFSREPYRIVECRVCGTTTKTRMNDA